MQKLLLFFTFLTTLAAIELQAMENKKVMFPVCLPRYAPLRKTQAQRLQDEAKKADVIQASDRQKNIARAEYHREMTQEHGSDYFTKKRERTQRHSIIILSRQQKERDQQKSERARLQQQATRNFYASVVKSTAIITCVGAMAYIAATSVTQNLEAHN